MIYSIGHFYKTGMMIPTKIDALVTPDDGTLRLVIIIHNPDFADDELLWNFLHRKMHMYFDAIFGGELAAKYSVSNGQIIIQFSPSQEFSLLVESKIAGFRYIPSDKLNEAGLRDQRVFNVAIEFDYSRWPDSKKQKSRPSEAAS